jgi:hypothetical protein
MKRSDPGEDIECKREGWMEMLYGKVAEGIEKIPSRYARNFVRGAISFPFAPGAIAESLPKALKRSLSRDTRGRYSLGSRMRADRTKEIEPGENPRKTNFDYACTAGGIVAAMWGLAALMSSFDPPTQSYVGLIIFGSGAALDTGNYVEQKIRY